MSMSNSLKTKIIAVDFDGTLCEDAFPEIGEPKLEVINYVKQLQKQGNKLILRTCREGVYLHHAITWCVNKFGLFFDAINDNLEAVKTEWKMNVRKIYCDVYIDDRSIHPTSVSTLINNE